MFVCVTEWVVEVCLLLKILNTWFKKNQFSRFSSRKPEFNTLNMSYFTRRLVCTLNFVIFLHISCGYGYSYGTNGIANGVRRCNGFTFWLLWCGILQVVLADRVVHVFVGRCCFFLWIFLNNKKHLKKNAKKLRQMFVRFLWDIKRISPWFARIPSNNSYSIGSGTSSVEKTPPGVQTSGFAAGK